MISSPRETSAEGEPRQLPVSDDVARATLHALLDSDLLGVALVRAADWVHVMTNGAYEALLAEGPALGKRLSEVLPAAKLSEAELAVIVSTGRATRVRRVLLPPGEAGAVSSARYVTFALIPVRSLTPEGDGLLVLARDVSKEVHDERTANLFLLLARDMSTERDEVTAIRAAVAHAKLVLGASAASIFLLDPDGKTLHGALVGWDWTRTSFAAKLEQWPNVARAIAANEACHFTAANAERAEEGWFERRGIEAAICAPMATDGRVVGVLFFDFCCGAQPTIDLTLAKTIADQCALLVERETAQVKAET